MKAVHEKAIMTSKPWYEGTLYTCGLCTKKFKEEDTIKHHLKVGHKKKANTYMVTHPVVFKVLLT